MGLLANPYVLGAIILAYLASVGAAGYKGYQMGEDHVIAENAKLVSVEVRTRDAALAVTGEAISQIKVNNVTVRQKAETITRERVVYSDCKHDDDGLRLINEALTGQTQPAPAGKLPAAGSTH
jgi:hypothetical protein